MLMSFWLLLVAFIGNNSSATITDCYSTGNVASSGTYTGGFAGYNYFFR